MKKRISKFIISTILFSAIAVCLINCKKSVDKNGGSGYKLPKVLYITTGSNQGNGLLPEGVTIAIQTFNRSGALVELSSRDALLDPLFLEDYSIMILSTAIGYHDIDRKYSLTFLSDKEVEIITGWVKNGGHLIAGDNVGRNQMDATDRSSISGKLTPDNWMFSNCFGVTLEEKNIKHFRVEGNIQDQIRGVFIPTQTEERWTLVVDSLHSNNTKVLGKWVNNDQKEYPALVQNSFGKGMAYLLPSSYLLHPANVGGYWSAKNIEDFYEYVLDEYYSDIKYRVKLNPWPNAHENSFCISLNASGKKDEYERIFSLLNRENITPTVFVNRDVGEEVKRMLEKQNANIESNGYKTLNYRDINYNQTVHEILMNENYWDRKFKGFRFPYTRNSCFGMFGLNELGYIFDSSIGADNTNIFYGSVFPYNIPVATPNFYKTLNILEISPTFHDDYFYYKGFIEDEEYNNEKQVKDSRLFEEYLQNYWKYSTKPYSGVMVFIGHPVYSGHNQITLAPLESIIKTVKKDNAWIVSMEELSDYWNKIRQLAFYINEKKESVVISVSAPEGIIINDVTLKLEVKPEDVKVSMGKIYTIKKDDNYYLVFNAADKQKVEIMF